MAAGVNTNALIVSIYGSITDPESWPRTLDLLTPYMGAESAALAYGDLVHSELESIWTNSVYQEFFDDEERYALVKSGVRHYREAHGLFTERGLRSNDEISRHLRGRAEHDVSLLQQRLVEKYGVENKIALSPLNFRPNYFDFFSLHYPGPAGLPGPESLARADWFLPHLAKAMELSRPFLMLEKRFRAVIEVLDRLQLGVVVFGEDLSVWVKNESAARILERGDCITQTRRGTLSAIQGSARAALGQSVDDLIRDDGPRSKSRRLALPRAEGGEPYIADLSLVGDFHGAAVADKRGVVMVLVDPDRPELVDFAHMQSLYNLTNRESDVGRRLVAGATLAEISEDLGLSPNTVSTHMRALYRKLGTRKRAELVHLVHSVNIPISGDSATDRD